MEMKILCFTSSDRPHFYRKMWPTFVRYCKKLCIDYAFFPMEPGFQRAQSWNKIKLLIKLISNSDYDILWWVDDDMAVTNDAIDIRKIINSLPEVPIILQKDIGGDHPVNAGTMIVRKSALNILIDTWNFSNQKELFEACWEQDTVKRLMLDKLYIVEHKVLQSFCISSYTPESLKWAPGDFIAHFTGEAIDTRLKNFKQVLNNTHMKICAYNGLLYHHEMIGHILDYNIDIKIFSTNARVLRAHYTEFYRDIEHYLKLFPKAKFLPPQLFSEDDWDIIILLSDTDMSIKNVKNPDKYIIIDHTSSTKNHETITKRLTIRPYPDRSGDWLVPSYDINFQKIASPKIGVACVGKWVPDLFKKLPYLFENFKDVNFYLFTFHKYIGEMPFTNIKVFSVPNDVLLEYLKFCDYILIGDDEQKLKLASGSIALAYTTHCRILFPKGWKELYKLETPLEYSQGDTLLKPTIEEVEAVRKEAKDLILHRNNLYDKLIYSNISSS